MLGYCTHALIDALSRDRLYPPDLADGEEATLLLDVPGDDPGAFEDEALPAVKIDVVAWPDASGVLPPPRAFPVKPSRLASRPWSLELGSA